jgi:hypothetical protein
MRLDRNSHESCQYVLRRIGSLPVDVMLQVNDCLKWALALP